MNPLRPEGDVTPVWGVVLVLGVMSFLYYLVGC